MKQSVKIIAQNRQAKAEYDLQDFFEAGLALKGFEVKAAKQGKVDITGAYCVFHQGGLFLIGAKIRPYQAKNQPDNFEPGRSIKLLLHKSELKEIQSKIQAKKLTIVAVKLYNKRGFLKLEIALAKGLKKYQKRAKIKKRDIEIETARTLKSLKS